VTRVDLAALLSSCKLALPAERRSLQTVKSDARRLGILVRDYLD
jgi:hypothetical protein